MAWVATADELPLSDVVKVYWRGVQIKKILNGTSYIWPDPWEDAWNDTPV